MNISWSGSPLEASKVRKKCKIFVFKKAYLGSAAKCRPNERMLNGWAQKMRGKEEKKGRGKEEKEKIGDQIAKKKVRANLFPLRSRHFSDQSEISFLAGRLRRV